MKCLLRVLGCVLLLACQSAGEASGLVFDPSELEVSVPRGLVQTFDVASGEIDATFSVSQGSEWLSVTSDTGVARVTVDASELEEGARVGEVRATRVGYKAAILPVHLTVTPQESVVVSLAELVADVPEGAAEAVPLTFSLNTGNAEITLSTSDTWLTLDVAAGTDPLGTIARFDASQLAQGDHTASIVATAPGYAATTVPVTLTVTQPAIRFVTPDLAFTLTQAVAGAQQLGIVATKGSASFSISSPGWLTVTTDQTTTPATASINLSARGMTQVEGGATKTGTVTITPVSPTYVGEPLSVTVTWSSPRSVALVTNIEQPPRIDVGYTGQSHGIFLPRRTIFSATVQCGSTFSQDCQLTGLAPNSIVSGRPSNQRCLFEPWVVCSQDADCDSDPADECVYFLSAPVPSVAGGVPTCALFHYTAPLSGTINLSSGAISLGDIALRGAVASGDGYLSPCPECVAGQCDGGVRAGQPCTMFGRHALAPSGLSLDCPVDPGSTSVSGWDLRVPGWSATSTTTEHELSIVAGSPSCDGGGTTCVCGACSLDSAIACQTNADCPAGAGACVAPDTLPNSCSLFSDCDQEGASLDGNCTGDGSIDYFCSVWTMVPCSSHENCTGTDPGAGTCSVAARRKCFFDLGGGSGTLRAENRVVDQTDVRLGTSFCAPATYNSNVNIPAGLPGPIRFQMRSSTEIVY